MGRAEKTITTTNEALRDLAQWLRDQRARAGLSYRALAERVGLHATTLQRVASGNSVPRLLPVLAYARGCDAQTGQARQLWHRARREHIRLATQHSRQPAPVAALFRDFADLSAGLRELYERAGAPPLRTMEVRAGGYGALPRSSAHRIVNKQTVPHSLNQFQAYLRACEVPRRQWKQWEEAWARAWRFEKQEDASLKEHWQKWGLAVRGRHLVEEKVPRFHRPLAPRHRISRAWTLREFRLAEESRAERRRAVGYAEMEPLFSLPFDTPSAP
ncbi:helix-turn-helix domain-containing protein [Streptomyces sp. N2A]|uniref:helix-turn-helix domain-containing protein n=1 Tax=Streptomyces sp. N2A TaxID=3073936 RepID=UPI00287049B7|nr:helix-turn-helix domain-containing protein [Streptomyces sp. N2A]